MKFMQQYFEFIGYALMGLVFMFASFYLFANLYHYFEIRKDYVTDFSTQTPVVKLNDKLNSVQQNISKFNANTYKGKLSTNQMMLIKQNLTQCVDSFNNETFKNMNNKDRITILDVYKLRESYEDDILNGCIVTNLYWTTSLSNDINDTYMKDNMELSKLYVNTIRNNTSYLKKDLINNSSYYYNTSIVSGSVKDNTRDGFYEVMDAYNEAADFLLYVSNWFSLEAGE